MALREQDNPLGSAVARDRAHDREGVERDHPVTNERPIGDVIEVRLGRRGALKGLLATAGVGLVGETLVSRVALAQGAAASGPSSLNFEEVAAVYDENMHVAPGYKAEVLLRWGDPIHADAPEFDVANQTAEAQEKQFGYNNDFIAFMPLPAGSNASERGLLCVNHEYTNPHLMWEGLAEDTAAENMSKEQVDVDLAAHGMSVVEVRLADGGWEVVKDSPHNRRLSMLSTEMRVSGPAAGHERMKTSADPEGTTVVGTLNNCAGGTTPWGTVLTAEENFHQYFGVRVPELTGAVGAPGSDESAQVANAVAAEEADPDELRAGVVAAMPQAAAYERYGVDGNAGYGWSRFHDRFDLEKEPNEPNRFGWIVEFDPYDPESVPVKRTAIGRAKHECCTYAVNPDKRVAFYSGDDERFDYLYRFVTARPYNEDDREANRDLLDEGTLYVAKFEDDGTMRWLPLVHGEGPLTAENGFEGQGDVVIEARRAADLLGATPMDRPEDVEANPVTGRVYVMLTNNSKRTDEQVDAVNPRAENTNGHIVELVPPGTEDGTEEGGKNGDHAADTYDWNVFILAGDPTKPEEGASYGGDVSANSFLSCPDNCAFDQHGRIWISTDGMPKTHQLADGLFGSDTTGEGRAVPRRFFAAPRGAEVCGPCFTPDNRHVFLAIQHPGEEDGSSFIDPTTRWPDFADGVPPRPSLVVISKDDGGEIGA